jgi:pyruvate/2-oxoglutarate dehydrogenase complex dihydrolipoamide acyltransferase (E2) component
MRFEVPLPALGDEDDAVQRGTVSQWLAQPGDRLSENDDLMELTTDKAAFIVASPRAGKLLEWCVAEGDTVAAGETLCIMNVADAG